MKIKELIRYFYQKGTNHLFFISESGEIAGVILKEYLMGDVNEEEFLNKKVLSVLPDIMKPIHNTGDIKKYLSNNPKDKNISLDDADIDYFSGTENEIKSTSKREFEKRYLGTVPVNINYKLLVDNTPLSTVVFDDYGKIHYKNQTFIELETHLGVDISDELIPSIIANFNDSLQLNLLEVGVEIDEKERNFSVKTQRIPAQSEEMIYLSFISEEDPLVQEEIDPVKYTEAIKGYSQNKEELEEDFFSQIKDPAFSLEDYLSVMESNIIQKVLSVCDGNINLSAKILKIDINDLKKKIKKINNVI